MAIAARIAVQNSKLSLMLDPAHFRTRNLSFILKQPARNRVCVLIWVLSCVFISCSPTGSRPVTIFAAASLKETISELSNEFEKRGRKTQVQFDASSTLARQIQQGALADVFITAAPEWLESMRILDRFDWLSNRLVIVVPLNDKSSFRLRNMKSLALANEQVPAGKYARAAFAHLHVPIPERTIYGSSVRDVLSIVAKGGAEAGVVYATDAATAPELGVAFTFPEESHPRIVYSVGLLRPEGKEFYDLLQARPEAATKHGFIDIRKQ